MIINKIRIGIVGSGFISDWHYQGFKINPNAEIVGLCQHLFGNEREKAATRKVVWDKCQTWNIKPYESFEKMAADKNLDA